MRETARPVLFLVRESLLPLCRKVADDLGLSNDEAAFLSLGKSAVDLTIGGGSFSVRCDDNRVRTIADKAALIYFPLRLSHGDGTVVKTPSRKQAAYFQNLQWDAINACILDRFASRVFPNAPSALVKASCKPLQLELLTRSGEKTPKWIISSSSADVAAFTRGRAAIVKHISESRTIRSGLLSRASLLEEGDAALIDGTSPVLCQEYIDSPVEYRVYVFGEKTRCCAFQRKKDAASIDLKFQYAGKEIPGMLIEAPELCARAVNIAKLFGLGYAAIDFIGTLSDTPYVLEINPLGMWEWMPAAVSDAIEAGFRALLCEELTRLFRS